MNVNVIVIGYVLQRLQAELACVGSWIGEVLERTISEESSHQFTLRTVLANSREPMLATRGNSSGKGPGMFKVTGPGTVYVNSVYARP